MYFCMYIVMLFTVYMFTVEVIHTHCNTVYCLRVYMVADLDIRLRIFMHAFSCSKNFAFAGEKKRENFCQDA